MALVRPVGSNDKKKYAVSMQVGEKNAMSDSKACFGHEYHQASHLIEISGRN
jgi:hypothetical protein